MNIFLTLLLTAVPLFAQDFTFDKDKGRAVPTYIGQLKLIKGTVFKKTQDNKTEEVKIGARFSKTDTLITQENSFARMIIVDETILSIGPKTEINFAEFEMINKNERKAVFNLIKGQLSGHIKNKAKDGDITFKTKVTTMGVRGTQLYINHQTLKNIEVSEFALLSGKIEVLDDQNQPRLLTPGERMIVIKDSMTNKSANETMKLPQHEMEKLKAPEVNEELDFKPLLPLYKVSEISGASALYPVIKSDEKTSGGNNTPPTTEKARKDWRQNLKKLNEKLKENQENR